MNRVAPSSLCCLSNTEIQAGVSLAKMRINASDGITSSTVAERSSHLYCLTKAHDEVSEKTVTLIHKPQFRVQTCRGLLQRKAQLTSTSRDIRLSDLRPHFNKPIVQVAREFGICTTFLKRISRRCGIKRWPHRQIRSLLRTIDMLKKAQDNTHTVEEKMKYSRHIFHLETKLKDVIDDPDANGKLERVRKSLFFHKSVQPSKNILEDLPADEVRLERNTEAAASLMLSFFRKSFRDDRKLKHDLLNDRSDLQHDRCSSGPALLQENKINHMTRAPST
ncbi:unnamed protein product [Albugo candida]|uniref:RWP-RK domain-containing protein n=1 Tax=Albugo candida TaxID=65357 RepID=A0A024GFK6_9STRA|nr:unnamed protein product [Albugo candida]|eukprot:CCI45666.1 unnamed protein product [Albugo candida]